ncbi:MAG: efflux RND transporter periplasmic adaptor subunit [Lachnospiraceae bacterium]
MNKNVKVFFSVAAASSVLMMGGCQKKNETSKEDAVFVMEVASLIEDSLGTVNRFSGMVVSQGTESVKKDSTREVDEILVAVGDKVEEGQVLFTYDLASTEMQIREGELEIERMNNSIASLQKQLEDLNAQKAKASADEQLSYSLEIQSLETQIREEQYNLATKQLDLDSLRTSIDVTQVTAPVAGTIQSIGASDSSDISNSDAYITIMLTGDYRIKGIFSEQNASEIYEGEAVLVRSRQDENLIWTGLVKTIDYENPEKNMNDYYFDEMSSSTKYPFYIELDSSENLMMGQHVYIEPDYGQASVESREGLWLPEWYVVTGEDGSNYVWAADSNNKLEQRTISLGEYDENMGEYEILSGLEITDYIAFPEDGLETGDPITTEFIYNDEADGESYDIDYEDNYYENDDLNDNGNDSPEGEDTASEEVKE